MVGLDNLLEVPFYRQVSVSSLMLLWKPYGITEDQNKILVVMWEISIFVSSYNGQQRNSGLQYLVAATLVFAQTKRKACDFPTRAHTMVNHSCFAMSKGGDKPL